jgi:hypothetical protein
MIAIDSNILVYAHRRATPEHQKAHRAIEKATADFRRWGISLTSLAEFWNTVTHPASSGGPSTGAQAAEFIRSLVEAGAQIWLPGLGFAQRLIQMAVDLEVAGARIFDLQIALTAFDNGATEIWTHDHNFLSVPGLRVIDPLS